MYSVRFSSRMAPCPVYILKFLFLSAADSDKKYQGCLHAIVHASAFSHSHTHCITSPTVLMCVADCAGVEAYVQLVVLVPKIGVYPCSFA